MYFNDFAESLNKSTFDYVALKIHSAWVFFCHLECHTEIRCCCTVTVVLWLYIYRLHCSCSVFLAVLSLLKCEKKSSKHVGMIMAVFWKAELLPELIFKYHNIKFPPSLLCPEAHYGMISSYCLDSGILTLAEVNDLWGSWFGEYTNSIPHSHCEKRPFAKYSKRCSFQRKVVPATFLTQLNGELSCERAF